MREACLITLCIGAKVLHDISNSNVDDAEEALVLLFKLLLVKDLHRQDAAF